MSAEVDWRGCLAATGVDSREAGAASVKSEHTMRRGIVDNAIRIGADLYFADRLERLRIKYRHRPVSPVAGESPADVAGDGDAVNTCCVWNLSYSLAGVCIEHHHPGTSRDIEPSRRAVNKQIVPAALTANFDLLQQM